MTAAPGATRLQPPPRPNRPTAGAGSLPQRSSPVKTSLGKRALSIVLYGPSGVGKTSFAANWPGCGFFYDPQEAGIEDLVEYKQCPAPKLSQKVNSFEALMDHASDIANKKYDIQTVVFDSMTGFEKLCFKFHCKEYFDNDWSKKGFYSYFAGPKNAAKTDWPRFLDALDAIRDSGINTILIGHSEVRQFSNPEGADYDRWIPYLDKETWQQTHRWAQCVLFYNYHVSIEKEESSPKRKANMTSERRFLYTTRTAAYDAKNRYGLPPLIDAGDDGAEAYKSFIKEFEKIAKV